MADLITAQTAQNWQKIGMALEAMERAVVYIDDGRVRALMNQELERVRKALDSEARIKSSKRQYEHTKRILAGARVPREDMILYKLAAYTTGRSLYRFVLDALEREYARTMERGTKVDG